MAQAERDVLIEGWRWCPVRQHIAEYDEGEEDGCLWCLDIGTPHSPIYRKVAGAGHVEDVPLSASEPNPPKAGRHRAIPGR